MLGALAFLASFVCGVDAGLRRPWIADMPFNQFPMISSHDAGTGYLPLHTGHPVTDIINRFTKTQGVGMTGQLDCGARAFDWRPYLDPTTQVCRCDAWDVRE